ncbi:MAG: hypothetical protein H7A23_01760 [Leptospiraceae bacterium]|nr:hypothetical protein [Leptospiraceae bacterium]MCP5493259.1 hypothetical protein [Leptospiraceae bacterium]
MKDPIINHDDSNILEKLIELNKQGYMLSLLLKDKEGQVYYDLLDKAMYTIPVALLNKRKKTFYSNRFKKNSEELKFAILFDVVAGIIINNIVLLIHEAPKTNSQKELYQILMYLVGEEGSNYDEQNYQKGQPF